MTDITPTSGVFPSSGVFRGREHHLPVRVYYEDTDFTGVVYHANYLRFFERGRSDFLRAAGISHTELQGEDTAFVVTHMDIDFRRAARIDDALVVVSTYDEVKGVRLLVSQKIFRGEELIAEANVTAACISLSGKPKRPPISMVEKLTPWFAIRAS
jgi:acyl-CoA thioester hydrolase